MVKSRIIVELLQCAKPIGIALSVYWRLETRFPGKDSAIEAIHTIFVSLCSANNKYTFSAKKTAIAHITFCAYKLFYSAALVKYVPNNN